ncbi:hypothetical protein QFC24_006368 [Naganishia onofrii]|uniref:Uncharacterized protein n=1 Tax=Naganishia onofrii TaxID=1851511 RepID=A0ACC2X0R2_9TREE|nr:hypothetical protein QFC24_006368 [Naganishia onofrii]
MESGATPPPLTRPPSPGVADPLRANLLIEYEVHALFAFYFNTLNDVIALLDPILHTPNYCQTACPFLFSSILTVSAKVIRPDLYPACLQICEKMTGQAYRTGNSSIETIQSLALLAFWREANDPTAWAKTGHAIRLGFYLGLHRPGTRPLPADEMEARLILNRERTWLLSDHNLAMQYQLPQMILDEKKGHVRSWIQDHGHLACPQDAILAPALELCQLFKLLDDLVEIRDDDGLRTESLLKMLEIEGSRWAETWLSPNGR